ncbi:MAG: hypothetical protein ACRET0_06340 [Steroidobacteraceae bacterium]
MFAAPDIIARWHEWDRENPENPAYVRRVGSPTILVDGRDVAEGPEIAGSGARRIYFDRTGNLRRVPGVDEIQAALSRATASGGISGKRP